MKKLFTTLICATIFMPCIFSMNELEPISELYPYELTKKILLELGQNVHRYTYKEWKEGKAELTSRIIFNVSLVNKELYKELDNERNDPVTARTMIANLARISTISEQFIIQHLNIPGIKRCYELGMKLYTCNENEIVDLFKRGSFTNYSGKSMPILSFRASFDRDSDRAIIKQLLELGVSPNLNGNIHGTALGCALTESNDDTIKIILNYKPKKPWNIVLQKKYRKYLDLLIEHSTKEDLTGGLICCIACFSLMPKIMQKFIDHGANVDVALSYVVNRLKGQGCSLSPNNHLIKSFNFLCDKKAFNQESVIILNDMMQLLASCLHKLEDNQNLRKKI